MNPAAMNPAVTSSQPAFDLVFRNALLRFASTPVDIGVAKGRIAAIEPALACDTVEINVEGRLVLPGFVDTHIHLDKACLLGRCSHDHASPDQGNLGDAIRAVSAMKRKFSVE